VQLFQEGLDMRFIKANPNQYLVVGRRGRVSNRGVAASAFLWPGSTFVLIPSTQQEATFEMTQESKDSIPLRFKGIVVYRVVDAEATARRFDFSGSDGHQQIKSLLGHVCLGELRAVVAHLTMEECIEQRKTILTDAVESALREVIRGRDGGPSWGIELDVVQVAQVFIVDTELRKQLEAEVRNGIRVKSELSEVRTREGIKLAEAASERRLQQEALATEREKTAIAREKLRLKKEYERDEIESDAPNRLLQIEKQAEVLRKEMEKCEVEVRVKELKARADLVAEKARQALRLEALPLEQAPAIAEALAQMLQGVTLSVYGQEAPLLSSLTPLVDLLVGAVRTGLRRAETAQSGAAQPS
jgi:regulator of protease activity HflC (stomatin/prohibitin superfamily)